MDETRLQGNDQAKDKDNDFDASYAEPVTQPQRPNQKPQSNRQPQQSQRTTRQQSERTGYTQEAYFVEGDEDEEGEDLIIRNPKGLLKTLELYKGKAKEASSFFKELGLSQDEVRELAKFKQQQEEAQREQETKELELKGQYAALADRKIQEATAEYDKQLTQQQKRNQALEKQVKELTAKLTETEDRYRTNTLKGYVKDAYLSNGGANTVDEASSEHSFDIFWDRYGKRFSLLDDETTIEVLDRTGQNLATDSEGNPLDLGGFINGLKGSNVGRMFFEGYTPQGNSTTQSQRQQVASSGNAPKVESFNSGVIDLAGMGYSLEDVIAGKVRFQQQR